MNEARALFAISTIGFLAVGLLAIRDVYFTMKKEYERMNERMKKEKEEVETVTRTLTAR